MSVIKTTIIKILIIFFQATLYEESQSRLKMSMEKMELNLSDNVGTNERQDEMEKLKKSMHTEKMLKVQAINKPQD